MTQIVDIALRLTEAGYYDEYIDENGNLGEEYGWDTSMLMDAFSNYPADDSEVLDELRRDGWIGNETPDIEGYILGSKYHVYKTGRNTLQRKNLLVDVFRDCFQHNVPEYYKSVTATGDLLKEGIRINISTTRLDGKIVDRYFNLWDFTGD
jgi:hypothetical protein